MRLMQAQVIQPVNGAQFVGIGESVPSPALLGGALSGHNVLNMHRDSAC